MAIFSDTDLDDFSNLATELALKDACDILRKSSGASDGQGGRSGVTWPSIATVKCLVIDAQAPQEQAIAQQVGKVTKTILFPRATDIRKDDRLRVAGVTYRIVDLIDPITYEVLRRVSVVRELVQA